MTWESIIKGTLGAIVAHALLATGAFVGSICCGTHHVVVHAQAPAHAPVAPAHKTAATVQAGAPTATGNTRLPGIDVSHYQGEVNWLDVAEEGVRFAFAKATEGITLVDNRYAQNAAGAVSAGVRLGAYHTFVYGDSAAAQVAHFLETAPLRNGMLPHGVDIESIPKGERARFQQNVIEWIDAYRARTGCVPVVYANVSTWLNDLKGIVDKVPHILWIAHPTDGQRDPGVGGWTFWQHSFAGRVNGVSGNVDLDYFAGTETDLDRILIRLDPETGMCAPVASQ